MMVLRSDAAFLRFRCPDCSSILRIQDGGWPYVYSQVLAHMDRGLIVGNVKIAEMAARCADAITDDCGRLLAESA